MLAKTAEELPRDGNFLFEPKWDGFRAIVFRGPERDDVYIQSRDLRPLDRYFPELHAIFLEQLPSGVVVDGEIVMPTKHGLDFGGLQMRLHPAASRVEKLAKATPAAFVAFDLLAAGGKSWMSASQQESPKRSSTDQPASSNSVPTDTGRQASRSRTSERACSAVRPGLSLRVVVA